MISRVVILTPAAREDLLQLFDWIAATVSPSAALAYVKKIELFIDGLEIGSERGTLRDDIRKDIRILGYRRRITIAFSVTSDHVFVLRVFSKGRNWAAELADDL